MKFTQKNVFSDDSFIFFFWCCPERCCFMNTDVCFLLGVLEEDDCKGKDTSSIRTYNKKAINNKEPNTRYLRNVKEDNFPLPIFDGTSRIDDVSLYSTHL